MTEIMGVTRSWCFPMLLLVGIMGNAECGSNPESAGPSATAALQAAVDAAAAARQNREQVRTEAGEPRNQAEAAIQHLEQGLIASGRLGPGRLPRSRTPDEKAPADEGGNQMIRLAGPGGGGPPAVESGGGSRRMRFFKGPEPDSNGPEGQRKLIRKTVKLPPEMEALLAKCEAISHDTGDVPQRTVKQ